MDRNKFSIKVSVIDGLLSTKSVFDKGAIGDIDGVPMFVNGFWFDKNLYVKYLEVSGAADGRAAESFFMAPAAAFLFGEVLTIPKAGNFIKIAGGEYQKLDSGRGGELARISSRALSQESRARVGDDDFLIRDFLIDARGWKVAGVMHGNWTSPEISRPSKLVACNGEDYYEFAA